jgi:hypothetical protein
MAVNGISSYGSFVLNFQQSSQASLSISQNSDQALQIQLAQSDAVQISFSGDRAAVAQPEQMPRFHGRPRLQHAQQLFNEIDANGDGSVTKDELQALKDERSSVGQNTRFLDKMIENFDSLDNSGSGALSFEQLFPKMAPPPNNITAKPQTGSENEHTVAEVAQANATSAATMLSDFLSALSSGLQSNNGSLISVFQQLGQ